MEMRRTKGTTESQRAKALPKTYPLPVRRLHDKFRKHEMTALQHFDLARTYLNDGAYSSGAKYLRLAADELEIAQAARNDALNMLSARDVRNG